MTDYTPDTEEVRDAFCWALGGHTLTYDFSGGEPFDRWLAGVKTEFHREGYETARQDLVSGAFVGGSTYDALRASFTGRKIAAEALRGAAADFEVYWTSGAPVGVGPETWLRTVADRIEKGD